MRSKKEQIFTMFNQGRFSEARKAFAQGTVSKYLKLWLVIKMRNSLQQTIDLELYQHASLPKLKKLLREVEDI